MKTNEGFLKRNGFKLKKVMNYSSGKYIFYDLFGKQTIINSTESKKLLTKRAKIKKYLKDFEKNHDFLKVMKFPLNNWLYCLNDDFVRNLNLGKFGNSLFDKPIFVYDIKNCYPTIFKQLFSVEEGSEIDKILSNSPKKDRLRLLGGLAAHPIVTVIDDDGTALTEEKSMPAQAYGFYNCVAALSNINELILSNIVRSKQVFFVYADALFVDNEIKKVWGKEMEYDFLLQNFGGTKITVKYQLKGEFRLDFFKTNTRKIKRSEKEALGLSEECVKFYHFLLKNVKNGETKSYYFNSFSTILFK